VKDRSDAELIRACLDGDEQAWDALVNRYRRLIFSIPYKMGLQRDEAMEIFQAVWLDCFQELHSLRDVDRLQAWLVRIAVRKCYRVRQKYRLEPQTMEIMETDSLGEDPSGEFIRRLDQEQLIRSGIDKLTDRCRQIIEALFFEESVPTYADIAKRLGLSTNSIGFTRDRCLERLGKLLGDLGYEH
jgi:RNA polymerase sigma factor (sigma-70 family)